jgi:hypothetical protein
MHPLSAPKIDRVKKGEEQGAQHCGWLKCTAQYGRKPPFCVSPGFVDSKK